MSEQLKLIAMNELVIVKDDEKVVTTSRIVASTFGKQHRNVLRDIQNLECSEEFSRLNFELSDYEVRGKAYPEFNITKDGFLWLVLGYTGARAAEFKEAFIAAFNRLQTMTVDRRWIMSQALQYMMEDNKALQASVADKEETIKMQEMMLKTSSKKIAYFEQNALPQVVFTTASIAKEIGMLAVSLNQILEEAGIQYRRGGVWMLYVKYKDLASKSRFTYGNHNWATSAYEWTPAGRALVISLAEQSQGRIRYFQKSN